MSFPLINQAKRMVNKDLIDFITDKYEAVEIMTDILPFCNRFIGYKVKSHVLNENEYISVSLNCSILRKNTSLEIALEEILARYPNGYPKEVRGRGRMVVKGKQINKYIKEAFSEETIEKLKEQRYVYIEAPEMGRGVMFETEYPKESPGE